MRLTTYSNR